MSVCTIGKMLQLLDGRYQRHLLIVKTRLQLYKILTLGGTGERTSSLLYRDLIKFLNKFTIRCSIQKKSMYRKDTWKRWSK